MRGLLWAALTATAAWSGYWWVGSTAIETGVSDWFAAQDPAEISVASSEVHGIPNRFDLTLTDLKVNRPDLGLHWQTPFAQVYALTWKPWHVIAALPTAQKITYEGQNLTLNSSRMIGDAIVHPNSDLALSELVSESSDLELSSDGGWRVTLASLLASMREDPTQANTYRLGLRLTKLVPDPSLTPALTVAGLPERVDEVYLDAHASLSAALNRAAAATPPTLQKFNLNEARLTWGDLLFKANGSLTADAQGFASGKIALSLTAWQKLPPLLVALGLMQPQMQPTVTGMMQAMAAQSGDPAVLDLTLTAKNGLMALGPFPLGPAPKFGYLQ